MTKEQREELYDLLENFAGAWQLAGVEFEEGDYGVDIVGKEQAIVDFIESEVEKAKKEEREDVYKRFCEWEMPQDLSKEQKETFDELLSLIGVCLM